jgi:uncharacterized protein with PIN domain
VQPSESEPQRGDIKFSCDDRLFELCRSLRELIFDRRVNPQLALWATDIAARDAGFYKRPKRSNDFVSGPRSFDRRTQTMNEA